MEMSEELLQCVGRLEIASPKPVGFLCGTLPVVADAMSFSLPHSALDGGSTLPDAADGTDLNTLPLLPNIPEKVFHASAKADLHWENGSVNHNLSRKCESLAVSGLTEYDDEIDVVAPTDIMKQIFKIPYSKAQLSIAVHRIGNTLILNTGPDVEESEKMFRRQTNQSKSPDSSIFLNFAMHSVRAEACDCPPSHHAHSGSTGSTFLPGQLGHGDGNFVSSPSSHIGKGQFIGQSVKGSRSGEYSNSRHEKFFWDSKNKPTIKKKGPIQKASMVGEKTRCPVQDTDKCREIGNNGFQRVLFWQFHNFRMLLGSDLLVFSNEKYVAVSLHLWDIARQVTPLTWLEAWLDNVMASVPELAICYHQNGVVQGYELLKTDDIFLLKGISEDGIPAFHPQIVQQNGLSVLRFLQDNCKQILLYRNAGDEVLQLFNLSVVPENHSPTAHDSGSPLSSLMHEWRRNSLFSLGTVLCRIGHRLSLSKLADNKAKCAKFFKKCLDIMCEQHHLVFCAHAHEQFARLILNSEEELDLTTESFLLESVVTVTDVEDDFSVSSGGMFESSAQCHSPMCRDMTFNEVKLSAAPDVSGLLRMEGNLSMKRDEDGFERIHDLAVSQISPPPAHLVQTVTDPVSSKLAAIYHLSQAIKSLRWQRQLQNAGHSLDDGNEVHDRLPPSSFSVCACGDTDCIEVCDIQEWLPKSRMDGKMWKLVLLLGESYLALGEAYKDDGRLDQALKIVKLACSLYGSMPQQLEGSQFISSMVSSSSSYTNFGNGYRGTDFTIDNLRDLNSDLMEDYPSSNNFSAKYLFWSKAWMLVGDVYIEHHRIANKAIPVREESKTMDSKLCVSEDVIKEVKRLKKKLGQSEENCSTCSLINCSCRSDRATSGNSASSSCGDAASRVFGRQNIGKPKMKTCKRASFSKSGEGNSKGKTRDRHPFSSVAFNIEEDEHTVETCVESGFEADSKDVPEVKNGGIFRFLVSPKVGDVEHNLLAAIDCYDAAREAMEGFHVSPTELQFVVKKAGWVFNELGRHRLDRGDLLRAELSFADAVKAFRKVSDHTNIILINCNLGHGRRSLAEELVSKMEVLGEHGYGYKQLMKSAKMEYTKSLKHYEAAKVELNEIGEGPDPLLRNEALTQLAHTYLRFGMLLSKEAISRDIHGKVFSEESSFSHLGTNERIKLGKHDISPTDAFGHALALYESLGELRRQEAAFTYFHFACYHKDFSLKLLGTNQKQTKHSKIGNSNHQKSRLHAYLAESNWQKSLHFYGPKSHPVMYLNILLEQSILLSTLSGFFNTAEMLESALQHMLEGRHAVVDFQFSEGEQIQERFRNHLLMLLKGMLAAVRSGIPNQSAADRSAIDNVEKLKEMYRMLLRSAGLCQLHAMHGLWIAPD
ncbi:unnamed protein product [Spirodela intermedia]|uniref:EDRF1 N-terminal domain-containing protein n=1 Tax=Spirodela intermedia TaxID=51605 RepID=A0A7I8IR81_SPIIN|nr:unnamed protein product [Spirodela intermedia]CAA6660462.1 unnamed protein product [Spirodela intermedia]